MLFPEGIHGAAKKNAFREARKLSARGRPPYMAAGGVVISTLVILPRHKFDVYHHNFLLRNGQGPIGIDKVPFPLCELERKLWQSFSSSGWVGAERGSQK